MCLLFVFSWRNNLHWLDRNFNITLTVFSLVFPARAGQPVVKENPFHHQWSARREAEFHEGGWWKSSFACQNKNIEVKHLS